MLAGTRASWRRLAFRHPRPHALPETRHHHLAFAEDLFHYFEHNGDVGSPDFGSHTKVIADHNGSFEPNAQASIDFTQQGAVMKRDSMDRWRTELRQQTNAIEISS